MSGRLPVFLCDPHPIKSRLIRVVVPESIVTSRFRAMTCWVVRHNEPRLNHASWFPTKIRRSLFFRPHPWMLRAWSHILWITIHLRSLRVRKRIVWVIDGDCDLTRPLSRFPSITPIASSLSSTMASSMTSSLSRSPSRRQTVHATALSKRIRTSTTSKGLVALVSIRGTLSSVTLRTRKISLPLATRVTRSKSSTRSSILVAVVT